MSEIMNDDLRSSIVGGIDAIVPRVGHSDIYGIHSAVNGLLGWVTDPELSQAAKPETRIIIQNTQEP